MNKKELIKNLECFEDEAEIRLAIECDDGTTVCGKLDAIGHNLKIFDGEKECHEPGIDLISTYEKSENDDLRTTITKQVEAITEMKGIIYMLQGLRIEDYSSEIEEDMVKLKKAYDGNLEDFLNYFKDD